ncbi:ATP-binding cassette domain-containing protein [Blastopirellula sp. J2-11]|uniref:ATP-binding cassette domain-containing protein n=1 Tax=Blastopirellula sp. J2-11 TaxID=2943192 RepID=UPI0021C6287D|nr:ATP-binding cassette domain-containing protein [Blastopirellula sp. J2-11]UUO04879.1 ATP-binding cassette domain-containing protein [Blastopirellula sp. J2-11]
MALISVRDVSISFHTAPLLNQANLQIEPGERVCLVGRNGTGKSTLLRMLAGEQATDAGDVVVGPEVRVATLSQTATAGEDQTVFDLVAAGLGDMGETLAEYHHLTHQIAVEATDEVVNRLDQLQHKLDMEDGWNQHQWVEQAISATKLDGDSNFAELSVGKKRRALFAQALASKPHVLLLDEPTNHLDIESILWLEEFLLSFDGTIVFVTHDRMFAQKLATRVVDIDRGKLTSWTCGFDEYVIRKEAALEAEEKQNALFDKRLAQEEVWVRQGIKARRTRNEGRVRALKKMRDEYQSRRTRIGTVKFDVQQAERSGQVVIRAEDISHSFGDFVICKDFSTTIMRGDKIGVLGPNGVGKTTLLRILLGELKPTEGEVSVGSKVEIAYFDQLHAALNEEQTLRQNIGEENEFVNINGRSRHVIGYLQEFLFTPEQSNRPIKNLSGGERNRLLLARLFAKPSNLLILDEPTNDLDADTLDLLEDLVVNYAGTLIVVSHDRSFLNNVVTSTIAFEGDGFVKQYAGGYDDWLAQRKRQEEEAKALAKSSSKENDKRDTARARKLTNKEQQELKTLPAKIEALEAEQAQLQEQMADPTFYQKPAGEIKVVTTRLDAIGDEMLSAMERWEDLESIAGG